MGDRLAAFTRQWFSANLEAVKSLKYQTPVGMEHLGLLGLGGRKADYLCWNLTGVNSPPPRKAAVGFLEIQEVTNSDFFFFFVLSGKLNFSRLCCVMSFWSVRLAGGGGEASTIRSHLHHVLWPWDVHGTSAAPSAPA